MRLDVDGGECDLMDVDLVDIGLQEFCGVLVSEPVGVGFFAVSVGRLQVRLGVVIKSLLHPDAIPELWPHLELDVAIVIITFLESDLFDRCHRCLLLFVQRCPVHLARPALRTPSIDRVNVMIKPDLIIAMREHLAFEREGSLGPGIALATLPHIRRLHIRCPCTGAQRLIQPQLVLVVELGPNHRQGSAVGPDIAECPGILELPHLLQQRLAVEAGHQVKRSQDVRDVVLGLSDGVLARGLQEEVVGPTADVAEGEPHGDGEVDEQDDPEEALAFVERPDGFALESEQLTHIVAEQFDVVGEDEAVLAEVGAASFRLFCPARLRGGSRGLFGCRLLTVLRFLVVGLGLGPGLRVASAFNVII